ncbi:MAG: hypothetical protein ACREEO_11665, partial [Phenylobacterium sp.]
MKTTPQISQHPVIEGQWPREAAPLGAARRGIGEIVRRIVLVLTVAGMALGLAACGHNVEQRAATG